MHLLNQNQRKCSPNLMLMNTMSLKYISGVVPNNEFHKMCMKELHQKHNDHQTLKMAMYEMRVKEADLMKRIGDLIIKNNTVEKNRRCVYEKTIGCMST